MVPQPPAHNAHHEGFLFRKLDIETLKKSTNRWVFRVMIMGITSGLAEDRSSRAGGWTLVSSLSGFRVSDQFFNLPEKNQFMCSSWMITNIFIFHSRSILMI